MQVPETRHPARPKIFSKSHGFKKCSNFSIQPNNTKLPSTNLSPIHITVEPRLSGIICTEGDPDKSNIRIIRTRIENWLTIFRSLVRMIRVFGWSGSGYRITAGLSCIKKKKKTPIHSQSLHTKTIAYQTFPPTLSLCSQNPLADEFQAPFLPRGKIRWSMPPPLNHHHRPSVCNNNRDPRESARQRPSQPRGATGFRGLSRAKIEPVCETKKAPLRTARAPSLVQCTCVCLRGEALSRFFLDSVFLPRSIFIPLGPHKGEHHGNKAAPRGSGATRRRNSCGPPARAHFWLAPVIRWYKSPRARARSHVCRTFLPMIGFNEVIYLWAPIGLCFGAAPSPNGSDQWRLHFFFSAAGSGWLLFFVYEVARVSGFFLIFRKCKVWARWSSCGARCVICGRGRYSMQRGVTVKVWGEPLIAPVEKRWWEMWLMLMRGDGKFVSSTSGECCWEIRTIYR